jgi:hypothetical protein
MNLMERRRALMGESKKIKIPLGLKDFIKGGNYGTMTYDSNNDTLRRYGSASWQGVALPFSTETGYRYTVKCTITVVTGNARISVREGTNGNGGIIKVSPSQTSGTERVTFTFDHDSRITGVYIFASYSQNIGFDVTVANFVFCKEKIA